MEMKGPKEAEKVPRTGSCANFCALFNLDIFPVLFESAFFRSPFESGPLLPPRPIWRA